MWTSCAMCFATACIGSFAYSVDAKPLVRQDWMIAADGGTVDLSGVEKSRRVLSELDVNGDGFVEPHELQDHLARVSDEGSSVAWVYFKAALEQADTDHDGKISLGEIHALLDHVNVRSSLAAQEQTVEHEVGTDGVVKLADDQLYHHGVVDQAPQEDVLAKQLENCSGVFVDAGANIGMHARFLFEPNAYPDSTYKNIFNERFGNQRDCVCAVEFEPNPAHHQRLTKLSAAYARRGWRVIAAPFGVSSERGSLTFYHNDHDSKNEEWGFGFRQTDPKSVPVVVHTLDFGHFLKSLKETSKVGQRPVVVKMDIEGAEFAVLPSLIERGVLCSTVDTLTVEFHARLTPLKGPHGQTLKNAAEADALSKRLREAVRKSAPACRMKALDDLDDESYLHDRDSQQLNDPKPAGSV